MHKTKVWAPVPPDVHKRVKRLALESDKDMQDVVRDALLEYLQRHEGNGRNKQAAK